MLVLVCLEIVLFLTHDRCMVCVEPTIGSEIILDASDGFLGDEAQVDAHFGLIRDSANLDRCMACAKCTIGLELVLDAPDRTPS
jgi:hypothetical protein